MPRTRQQEKAMDGQMKDMMDLLLAMKAEMKAGQEDMRAEIKAGQEDLKNKVETVQDEMKTGQDTLRAGLEEMRTGQEQMKSGLSEEIKAVKDVLHDRISTVENRIDSVEEKFSQMETEVLNIKIDVEKMVEEKLNKDLEQKIEEKFSKDIRGKIKKMEEDFEKKSAEKFYGRSEEEVKIVPVPSHAMMIKPSTYDGKTSWSVYKTQFSIVAEANKWDSEMKASQLAASLRGDAADILGMLTKEERLNFDSISNALELRFGEKCIKDYSRLQLKTRQQKITESLQELATDIERLAHQAYPDCPSEVRENLAMMHFIDAVKDPEIQKALRLADLKDLKAALIYAMKVESAQQATRKDRHQIRAVRTGNRETEDASIKEQLKEILKAVRESSRNSSTNRFSRKPIKCWNCGVEGHLRKNCRVNQNREEAPEKSSQEN